MRPAPRITSHQPALLSRIRPAAKRRRLGRRGWRRRARERLGLAGLPRVGCGGVGWVGGGGLGGVGLGGVGASGGLVDPAADAVDEFLADGGLGVAHPGQEPQLFGLAGGHVELPGVLGREVRVLVTMHDQQRNRRDLGRRLGRGDRDQLPAFRADPGLQPPPGHEPAQPVLDGQVHPAHPLGAAVIPAAGAADRHHRVQAADQAGVPEHDRGAHGEADRGDPPVTELAGPGDGHIQVLDLPVAQRGQPAGAAVTAEVEGHHARHMVEPVGDAPDVRALPGQREPVRDDDGQVCRAGEVDGVDRDAVLSDQGRCRHHRLGQCFHLDVRLPPRPGTSGPGRRW